MSEDLERGEVSAEGPGGFKFRARGYDAVVGTMMLAVIVLGYGLWMHMVETKTGNQEIARAIKDGVKVQKFTACILATDDHNREAQYSNPQSFCNRMAQ